jgi:hypothetical protein
MQHSEPFNAQPASAKNLVPFKPGHEKPFPLSRTWYLFILILLFSSNNVMGAAAPLISLPGPSAYSLPPDTPGKERKVYRMNYWISGGFSALATLGNMYAIPNILHSKKNLSDAEIAALRPDIYNGIDRWALKQDPSKREAFYKASDVMLPALILGGASIVLDKSVRKDWGPILLMYLETQAMTFTLYNYSPFGPAFQNRLRPVVYYPEMPIDLRKGGNQRNSMFSGHVANASAATFFFVKVYSDYHPEIGNKKFLLYGLASVPPLAMGYLRMKALAHFPSDILVGYALGAVCGVAIPALHRFRPKNVQVGISYNNTSGAGLRLAWQPAAREKKLRNSFGQP